MHWPKPTHPPRVCRNCQQSAQRQARIGERRDPGHRREADYRQDQESRGGSKGAANPQRAETAFLLAHCTGETRFNPAAIEANFIASAKSRDVALTLDEIGRLLRAIYQSSMKRAHKRALQIRKSELIEAKREELELEKAEWAIPGERMKKDRPHLVPRREMLQWWADFVDAQIQDGRSKVIIGPFGNAYRAA
jgi:integrase